MHQLRQAPPPIRIIPAARIDERKVAFVEFRRCSGGLAPGKIHSPSSRPHGITTAPQGSDDLRSATRPDASQYESGRSFVNLRLKWLKNDVYTIPDGVPESIPSPTESQPSTPGSAWPPLIEQGSNIHYVDRQKISSHMFSKNESAPECPSTLDWLIKQTNSSYKRNGELLLFLQSSLKPERLMAADEH